MYLLFCVFTAFLLCLSHQNAKTIRCNIAISTACHWASLQICGARYSRLCHTSANQILINDLKVCLFVSDKSRTTHNAFKYDFAVLLKYDVIEWEKVKAVSVIFRSLQNWTSYFSREKKNLRGGNSGVARGGGGLPAPGVTISGWHHLVTLFGPPHLFGPKTHSIFGEDLFFGLHHFRHNFHVRCHTIKGDTTKSRPGCHHS